MTGDGRRGRRDNGLDAAAFVPLLDVDPRVGEHLLDVLASAGVPAYLEPSADVEPYTRALSLPSPPTDRLWVDRDQRRQARMIVDAETPLGPAPGAAVPGRRALARAVRRRGGAGLAGDHRRLRRAGGRPAPAGPARPGRPARPRRRRPDPGPAAPAGRPGARRRPATGSASRRRRPARPGAGRPHRRPVERRGDRPPRPAPDPRRPGRRRRAAVRQGPGQGGRVAGARHETEAAREDSEDLWIDGPPTLDSGDEEHFEPPPPPPLPRPSRNTVLAVLLVLIGVLLIAVPQLIGLDDRTGLTLGVLAVLAGARAAGAAAARGPRRGRAGRRRRGLSPG